MMKFDYQGKMPDSEVETKQTLKAEVLEYAESLVMMFAFMLLVFTFLARPATVDGHSMNPSLHDKERLVISGLFYQPTRGDIVVIANSADKLDHKNLIKRIVATEGQTVDIDFEAGEVFVDGQLLDEPYIAEPTYLSEGMVFPLTVPDGEVFAMGDNRNNSRDSRSTDVGTIMEDEIVGRCIFRFMPFNRFGRVD